MVNPMFIQSAYVTAFWKLDCTVINDAVPYKSRKEMKLAALIHFQQTVKIDMLVDTKWDFLGWKVIST
jgi:hypothetical protein